MEGDKMSDYNQRPEKNVNSKKFKEVQKKQALCYHKPFPSDQPETAALEADSQARKQKNN